MKRKGKGRGMARLTVLLVLLLAAVIGLIAWKQWEYGASADFYGGLRGAWLGGGLVR